LGKSVAKIDRLPRFANQCINIFGLLNLYSFVFPYHDSYFWHLKNYKAFIR
jgi:hypothetical protein